MKGGCQACTDSSIPVRVRIRVGKQMLVFRISGSGASSQIKLLAAKPGDVLGSSWFKRSTRAGPNIKCKTMVVRKACSKLLTVATDEVKVDAD